MLAVWSENVEYDLEKFSITNFYYRGKNIKNKGIRMSMHLVTLSFYYEKMMFCPEAYQLMGSWFCCGSVFVCLLLPENMFISRGLSVTNVCRNVGKGQI